jgi:hypothetical protein
LRFANRSTGALIMIAGEEIILWGGSSNENLPVVADQMRESPRHCQSFERSAA